MAGRHRRRLLFANPAHSVLVGIALTVAGSYLLYEGYERRGRTRPWAARLLPGP